VLWVSKHEDIIVFKSVVTNYGDEVPMAGKCDVPTEIICFTQ